MKARQPAKRLLATRKEDSIRTELSANPKFGVVTLGCPKNQVDTEVMLAALKNAGFDVTFDNEAAEICLVNTCSFIEEARRESVRHIVELACQGKQLIIAGCLAQHFKEELLKELPEARAVVGTGDLAAIVEIARAIVDDPALRLVQVSDEPAGTSEELLPRLATGVGPSSYLKIAEGCNHACTFCIIPRLRGKFRSRSLESLLREAQLLAQSGTRELVLVAQDSSYYGLDLYGRLALGELLEALSQLDGLDWIRVMYFYPGETNRQILDTMARLPRVVKYVDIPLQHSHPDILSAMARPLNPGKSVELVREIMPQAAIRSTFIVGFPGETEEHFGHLQAFVEKYRFDRLGVFAYSQEKDSASGSRKDQLPRRLRNKRRQLLMSSQLSISRQNNERLLHTTLDVLVEGYDEARKMYFGRSQWDAPEIDNKVYIYADGLDYDLLGEIIPVRITKCKPYDLYGHAARHS
jgi:ribosomal protein S12 methylthiotransferase